jgi:hypothetical protein
MESAVPWQDIISRFRKHDVSLLHLAPDIQEAADLRKPLFLHLVSPQEILFRFGCTFAFNPDECTFRFEPE